MLNNVRQLWYWNGAFNIVDMAAKGVSKPDECKFTCVIAEGMVTDAIVIIPCTEEAIKSLEAVKVTSHNS